MKEPSPYEVAYNLSKNLSQHYLNGQEGQAVEIEKIFKGKLPDIYCDFVLLPLFPTGKKNGFFIEAGAFDGELFSNTLGLEML